MQGGQLLNGVEGSSTGSANDLALTAGAGLDVRVWKGLSIAADARYLHLFDDRVGVGELDITRIGAKVSWSY